MGCSVTEKKIIGIYVQWNAALEFEDCAAILGSSVI
jgi:hypothetical protein